MVMNDAMANAWREETRLAELFGFIGGFLGGG
jgi:hypothetical protein